MNNENEIPDMNVYSTQTRHLVNKHVQLSTATLFSSFRRFSDDVICI